MKNNFRYVLFTGLFCVSLFPVLAQNSERFRTEVEKLTSNDQSITKKNVILFTGSSSIRLWTDLNSRFPELNIVNRGFGGSQTTDLLYYFDNLILPYGPKKIFIYEGDNDINSGKTPQQILSTTDSLVTLIRQKVSKKVTIYFITPKPSIARWSLKSTYEDYIEKLHSWARTNPHVKVIDVWHPMLDEKGVVLQDVFVEDRLHMNKKGYDIWAKTIAPYLN